MSESYRLGELSPLVIEEVARLYELRAPARMRAHDHTFWADNPAEISDRLNWLTLPEDMATLAPSLREFGESARADGYRHVVLLGMGGSSLGPEVIRRVIGNGAGYPQLLSLDSTVPGWVAATTESIDPAHSLFIVSSKSGTTTEPNAFYAHFRQIVDDEVGREHGGRHFVAVTDPQTPLAQLASDDQFQAVFLNDPNIGGRYSVLSHFGLVPAALSGVDLGRLLKPAASMQNRCSMDGINGDNPGIRLGAAMGTLAKAGRDKLTLLAPESLSGFGLWVEQLLAESTGKNGTGVIPIVDEPLQDVESYGDDRFFVELCLSGDEDSKVVELASRLQSAGHPVVRLQMAGAYDLGAEFYRWEYATAVAGHILGINPFDQPDVQGAKDRTISVLNRVEREGQLPNLKPDGENALRHLLENCEAGDYLAIMAYLPDEPAVAIALADLRERVTQKYGIATTVGYGPRFLHSTGQLHKGGPASGLFLQLTADHTPDVAIPGWPISFGTLADAQALGDLQALQDLGRRTVSFHMEREYVRGIRRLVESV